jgi:hypothetical protein
METKTFTREEIKDLKIDAIDFKENIYEQ